MAVQLGMVSPELFPKVPSLQGEQKALPPVEKLPGVQSTGCCENPAQLYPGGHTTPWDVPVRSGQYRPCRSGVVCENGRVWCVRVCRVRV